ncbi:PTS lactose/cellobiose transporter subunit IIA [Ectobacillus sp. JY-23]|uniref:PTS lactose/cellobiose transporter subunit IIA n=1 Tax=Ectobacillus sp. JY-23 TaxID=2933872 RepID=UPI001FF2B33F|nr:PTS lactose/cellobiose transporter subunit IIA [Ectobacillus sp. JY-23]UOY92527.1 PTS lactose/cellobiose transporter subunit IIA [Ectobacillus sp. JY-23]
MTNQEQDIFEIISHGGNARSLAYEALTAAEEYDFEKAESLLKEASAELGHAHKTQTRLIQAELNGNPTEKSLLMIHAQDHLMTAISEQKLIEHMVRIIKKLKEER